MPSARQSPSTASGGKPYYLFVGNWVAIAALLPMVLAGFLLSYLFIDRRQDEAALELQRYVDGVAREIAYYVDSSVAIVQAMADGVARAGAPTAATHADSTSLLRARHPLILEAVLVDGGGGIVSASPADARAPMAAPIFTDAPHSVSGIQEGPDGRPSFAVAVGTGADGGILYARFALDATSAAPLASGDLRLLLEDAAGRQVVLSGGALSAEDGENSKVTASREAGGGFTVRGWRDVGGPFATGEFGEYAIAGTMLLLAALVSWMVAQGVAHRVTRPLDRLARDLADFSFGDKSHDLAVPDNAPREIRVLIGEFNALLQRLRSSYVDLQASLDESQLLRQRMERLIEERDKIIRDRTSDLRSRTAQLERANAALERVANEDGLTGTANRRAFDEFLALVWRLAVRERVPVSLILIDVDRFKKFNDHYGHLAGDECLRQVAAAIKSFAKRPLDLVARYGGEEFAIVLGRTGQADAVDVAHTVQRAIHALQIEHCAGGIDGVVTISLGVATLMPDELTQADDLIARADEYLYLAKENGRNRVEFEASA